MTGRSRPRQQIFAVLVAYAVLSIAVLWYFWFFPVVLGTDAAHYLSIAVKFHQKGLFDGLGNLRTYGYPLSLYLLTPFAGPELSDLSFSARCVQLMLYGGIVCS